MTNGARVNGHDPDFDPDFADAVSAYKDPIVPPDVVTGFYQPKWTKELLSGRLLSASEVARNLYTYTPLQNDEIRLIKLLPKKPGRDPQCKIMVKSLSKVRNKYSALSYHWGARPSDPKTEKVEIPPDNSTFEEVTKALMKGTPLPGTKYLTMHKNLYTALSSLAPAQGSRILWADAVCMNQDSELEKIKEVKRMAEVYNSAADVVVWLGPGDAVTNRGMDFIEKVVLLNEFDHLIRDESSVDGWDALATLMKFEWFSRRWVVQEIALARRATIYCGDRSVNWRDFADAILLFKSKLPQIRELFKKPRVMPPFEGLGALDLVRAVSNLARKSEHGHLQEHLVDLEILVSRLIGFAVSMGHDAIYAYLSLARDVGHRQGGDIASDSLNTMEIEVNYSRPVMEVFIDFTRKCIETSGSLDIICRYWAPDVELPADRPSWIKDVKGSTHGTPKMALLGWQARRNGASLVGAPYRDSQKTYNASGSFKAFPNLLTRSSNDFKAQNPESANATNSDSILDVRGFVLGVIFKHSSQVIQGIIDHTWLYEGGWNEEAKGNCAVPDKLWRTLVADRDENGENPPSWYGRACYQGLTDETITGGGQHLETRADRIEERQPLATMLQQYLQRVRHVVWNRKFFLANLFCQVCKGAGRSHNHSYTACHYPLGDGPSDDVDETSEKDKLQKQHHHAPAQAVVDSAEPLFGLAPRETEEGDLICILAGCSVPVILRSTPSTSSSSNGASARTYYQVVGEAFVYGKMDGEAVSGVDRSTMKKKFLTLSLK